MEIEEGNNSNDYCVRLFVLLRFEVFMFLFVYLFALHVTLLPFV